MGRLTIRIDGEAYIDKVANKYCEAVCSSRNRCNDCPIRDAFNKLAHYEDLEEQGRLICLPCKVGDTVYYINTQNRLSLFKNTVYEAKVARFVTTRYGTSIVIQIHNEYGCTELYIEDNYNKTVFLTKEEALAKLKELKEGAE